MAIAPTGAIYKALEFDNVSSRTYGVYITGEAVYNAPERDVEMITIPGRSGSFALDNGRFENIEVSYPAGIYADTEADFRQAISDFRNFLCSRKGYVRLQDEYNPDEYRMAVYKSGLDVDPALLRAGEFTIAFDCKPQRWLVSGETAVAVTSGDTLTNPTLFESGPLLEATGSGAIQFNGYEIDFAGIPYGEVLLQRGKAGMFPVSDVLTVNLLSSGLSHLLTGDAIYGAERRCEFVGRIAKPTPAGFTNVKVESTSNALEAKVTTDSTAQDHVNMYLYPDLSSGFAYGTSKTITSTGVYSYYIGSTKYTETLQTIVTYNGSDTITFGVSMSGTLPSGASLAKFVCNAPYIYGFSTEPLTGIPIYIDCDLGEAYYINDGEYVSLNQQIDLGSELPKLASGSNTVTFDNTITELNITPRWWKV